MASTAIGTSPWPVITMTGSSGSTPCESRSSSSPSIPSIFRSVTRMPGKSVVNRFSAVAAWSCTSVSTPARPSHCVTASRIEASSSTKRTGPSSRMDRALDVDRRAMMARKPDGQLRAAFRTVARLDLPAEVLNDAVGDRQPETEALADRLGGEERIEHPFDLVMGNAMTVVGYRDRHAVALGRDGDPDAWPHPAGDRVERVPYQVEDHLLELDRHSHHPDVRRDALLDAHARGLDVALQEKERALDGAFHQNRLGMAGLALARERLEVGGDAGHAAGEVVD